MLHVEVFLLSPPQHPLGVLLEVLPELIVVVALQQLHQLASRWIRHFRLIPVGLPALLLSHDGVSWPVNFLKVAAIVVAGEVQPDIPVHPYLFQHGVKLLLNVDVVL